MLLKGKVFHNHAFQRRLRNIWRHAFCVRANFICCKFDDVDISSLVPLQTWRNKDASYFYKPAWPGWSHVSHELHHHSCGQVSQGPSALWPGVCVQVCCKTWKINAYSVVLYLVTNPTLLGLELWRLIKQCWSHSHQSCQLCSSNTTAVTVVVVTVAEGRQSRFICQTSRLRPWSVFCMSSTQGRHTWKNTRQWILKVSWTFLTWSCQENSRMKNAPCSLLQ